MKATITHLKAPWPAGAKVGEVVHFPDGAPGWALGKFTPAADGAKADHKYAPAAEGDGSGTALPTVETINGQIADLQAAHAAEVQKLRADIDAGGKALQDALTENDALRAQLAAQQPTEGGAALAAADAQAAQEMAAQEKAGKKKA